MHSASSFARLTPAVYRFSTGSLFYHSSAFSYHGPSCMPQEYVINHWGINHDTPWSSCTSFTANVLKPMKKVLSSNCFRHFCSRQQPPFWIYQTFIEEVMTPCVAKMDGIWDFQCRQLQISFCWTNQYLNYQTTCSCGCSRNNNYTQLCKGMSYTFLSRGADMCPHLDHTSEKWWLQMCFIIDNTYSRRYSCSHCTC